MSDIAGSLVSGAMGALGTWINNVYEDRRAKEQRDWNEQMMNQQNAWNYQMWNEQNAYNTPAAQRQRMEEAGFNPVLAKGESGLAQQLTSEDVNPYERAHLKNPIIEGLNAAFTQAQISKTQNEALKVAEETETEKKRREEMDAKIKDLRASVQERLKNVEVGSAEYQKLMKEVEWFDRLSEANLKYQEAATKLSESQKKEIDELLQGKIDIQHGTEKEIRERTRKYAKEIEKLGKELRLDELEIENYILVHASNGIFGSGVSWQNISMAWNAFIDEWKKHFKPKDAAQAAAESTAGKESKEKYGY